MVRNEGKQVKVLVDTGASNNFCNITKFPKAKQIKLNRLIHIKTIHGLERIQSYVRVQLLHEQHIFYIVSNLGAYDMVLGMHGLRKVNALIDTKSFTLTYTKRSHVTVENINYIVSEEIESDYRRIIDKIMSVNERDDYLPFNTNVVATIRTTNQEPVWSKPYPYPMSVSNFVNSEIESLLKKGIIRPSCSPYNAPIWVVPKKGLNSDGTPKHRLVIDFQKLNSHTIFDRYPIPDTNIILSNLGNARYFSTIDLESGYHQIRIKESDKEKTAFSVNGAKYEYNRMPFGLKNAPSIFQRAVDEILRPFIGKFAYVYIDDVLIFSKTKEEHAEHIKLITDTLLKANMKLSNEKSKFFMEKIEYLGHIIANGRIKIDPKKVETIEKYPLPETLKQLRSFLGL